MRHTVLSAVCVIGFLATAGGALAQSTSIPPALPANPTPGVAAPTTPEAAGTGDDAIVCKYERMIGSLMTSRVCRTQRAWKLMQSEAHEFMGFDERGTHQVDEGGSGGGSH